MAKDNNTPDLFIDCTNCGHTASRVDDMTGKPIQPLTYFCEDCEQEMVIK